MTFPGRGMPSGGNTDFPRGIDKPRGDFIISFSIQYPDHLDRKWKKELIRKWQNESQEKREDTVGVVHGQVLPWPHMRSDTRHDKIEDHGFVPQINEQVLGRSHQSDLNCEQPYCALTTPKNLAGQASEILPTITFKQLLEPSSDISLYGDKASRDERPSFPFAAVSISLAYRDSCIIIGRNTQNRERLQTKSSWSIFLNVLSKVVSRNHCEFRYIGDRWLISYVGSSSRAFLNGERLSKAYTPSAHKVIHTGDLIQLGGDVEGSDNLGDDCVKMVVELNGEMGRILNEPDKRKLYSVKSAKNQFEWEEFWGFLKEEDRMDR